MFGMKRRLQNETVRAIRRIFTELDYSTLGSIYCHEGGESFWKAKREPCQRLGIKLAEALIRELRPGGRSLYVGAGVAELPPLLAEALDGRRHVEPYNLRRSEVATLNRVFRSLPVKFRGRDATSARGRFDHLWMVSVLNDPESFPHLSPLSYGEANPVMFNAARFQEERRIVRSIVNRCMRKLSLPGLVTTSTEEVVWIAEWCHRHRIPYRIGRKQYATALVGDPICFINIGKRPPKVQRSESHQVLC
jgi:hypothetical protein